MTASVIDWADPARASAFDRWLAAVGPQFGLRAATLRPASADASFRRYFRIDTADGATGGSSCIIMDAPPDQEDCRPFVKVAELLLQAGLNAPRVLAWEQALGFMLLSDLGAKTLLDVIAPPAAVDAIAQPTAAQFELFMDAVDVLVRWQLASRPGVLPPCDDALLSRELALFPEWYVGRHRGFALDAALMGKLDPIFAQIKASNLQSLDSARVYVHRDFMPRNLMVAQATSVGASKRSAGPPQARSTPLGGSVVRAATSVGASKRSAGPPQASSTPLGGSVVRAATSVGASERSAGPPQAGSTPLGGSVVRAATSVGANSLGVLDFQDAVYGPITYDIASLMRDAFLSWEEEFVLDITVRYWQKARKAALPVGDDFGEFYRAVEWMGLQRHLKVLGIFARLTLRDGKPKYLADTPRFIKYARATCARYRQLGPLMVLLDEIEGNETRAGYTF